MIVQRRGSGTTAFLMTVAGVALAAPFATAETIFESFEEGFGPWRARIGNPPIAWRVTPTREQAQDGTWSLDFSADGCNDDGQVYMVRELQLPAGTWTIGLDFYLWSPSDNELTCWWAIGFIGPYEPTCEADFTQSDYGARIGSICLAGWDDFTLERTLTVSEPTTAYVAFGYDIVWETERTHFLDSVTLTGVPVQCGNGTCFAGEDACNCPADCAPAPTSETVCDDGKDNDCDGQVDCIDEDCAADPACEGVVCDGDWVCETGETQCACWIDCGGAPLHDDCDNEIDDDCDGLVDCDDTFDCMFAPHCMPQDCDNDGVCESGEDCITCPFDCFSAPGAICGNGTCEIANGEDCLSCPADCNGKQGGNPKNRYCCGDGAGTNPVGCEDARCTGDGNTCTEVAASASCCGDGVCEGTENEENCAIDCAFTCTSDPECDDGDPCTTDTCTDGVCYNTPIDCDDGDACTTDDCSGGACTHGPITCDDGDVCTTDTCDPATGCVFTPIPGCVPCKEKGEPCSTDEECCSNKCRGGACR